MLKMLIMTMNPKIKHREDFVPLYNWLNLHV
jgi:hypothetical protein